MGHFAKVGFVKILDLLVLVFLWIPQLSLILCDLLLYLFRLTVHLSARLLCQDLIPINNSVDNIMSAYPSSSEVLANASQVWALEGKLSVNEFRKHFYTTFLGSEKLREKYGNLYCHFVTWGGYVFKKKGDLDLDERIHEKILRDGNIEEFVGNFLNTNDYGERPNWEIVLVHVLGKDNGSSEQDNKTIVVFKIDHGLCDGYTFSHLIERLTGIKSPYYVKDESVRFWNKVQVFLTLPRTTVSLSTRLLGTQKLRWNLGIPSSLLSKKQPKKFYLSFTTLDLDKVRRVRRLGNCHFNTVLSVLQALALRKLFIQRHRQTGQLLGDLPGDLPKHMYIANPTAWPNHLAMTQGGMANHLSVTMLKVSLEGEDPGKVLLKGENDYKDVTTREGMAEAFFLGYVPLVWPVPQLLTNGLKKILHGCGILSKISCYVSCLMLAQEEYKLMGVPVAHIYLPLHLQATLSSLRLIVIPVSNGGRLDVSVSGRFDSFQSQEEVDYYTKTLLKECLDELLIALEENTEKKQRGICSYQEIV